jgi:hypothetical protein
MKERSCIRCGKVLSPGSLTYVAQIRVFADFDGVILEEEGDVDHHLKRMLDEVEAADPEALEKEVFEEYTMILCKSCRDRFVDETRHPWEGPFWLPKGPGPFIH